MPSTTTKSSKTFDDASSTYSAASTSTVVREKEEAKRKWLFKSKSKPSNADLKSKDSAATQLEAAACLPAYDEPDPPEHGSGINPYGYHD
ncbi:hypothetical protein BDW68DRAFT_172790 [Aspergillus falconensis]